MARPFIDFSTPGATGDSDDTNQAAVKPVIDGDPANAATFNRMPENLRTRTEFIRQALNDLKYLADADKATLVTGGGYVAWGGASDVTVDAVTGTGIFTTTADITIRPFMAPLFAKRAKVVIDGPGTDTITVLVNSSGLQAYGSGLGTAHIDGNAYNITFALGGAFSAVLSGTPATDILVTFVSGTTTSALAALMAASATFIGLNLSVTSSGTAAITVLSDTPSTNTLPASAQRLLGAVDAERHVITAGTINTFFATVGNRLATGDTLAIYYDALFDNAGGGRREAVPNYGAGAGTDKTQVGVSGSLFNLRLNPEKAPLAIPVCTVAGDALVFVNQVSVLRGQGQNGLSAGFVQRTGDLMTGSLNISPAYIDVSEQALNIDIPALQSFGGGPVDQDTTALRIGAGGATGIDLIKPSGGGAALKLTHAGTDNAFQLSSSGVGEVLHIVSSNVAAGYVASLETASPNAALRLKSTHATGAALIARTSDVLSDPANTTAFIEGKNTDTLLKLRFSGTSSTSPVAAIDAAPPQVVGAIASAAIRVIGGDASNPGITDHNGTGIEANSKGLSPAITVISEEWASYGPKAAALLLIGKPSANGALLYATNTSGTITGNHALISASVAYLAGNTGIAVRAATANENDTAFSGTGKSSMLNAGTTTPALTLTGDSFAPLVLTKSTNGVATTATAGALGTRAFTPGGFSAGSGAALVANLGNSIVSGFASYTLLTPTTFTAGGSTFRYWVSAEGILSLRGVLNHPSSGASFTSGTPFDLGTLPNPFRPGYTADGVVYCLTAGAPIPARITVLTTGVISVTQYTGSPVTVSAIFGVSVDFPLW